jgi:pyruvate dehydrogenase E2 component (dihydrolipoamide acetyltransferase)
MAWEIVLPQWGMEMQDGVIVRWLKKEGDSVLEGDPIVEVETAKLQTELESTASGILAHIMAQEGDIVPIRGLLAVVAAPGEEVPRPSGATSAQAGAASRVSTGPASQSRTVAATAPTAAVGVGGPEAAVQVVPAARRLAQQNGIDLSSVRGSGPRGRILIKDVETAIDEQAQTPAPQSGDGAKVQVVPAARRLAQQNGIDLSSVWGSGPRGRILIEDVETAIQASSRSEAQVVEMVGIRRTVAARMMQSLQTMAQVTLTTEANVTEAMTLRRGLSGNLADGNLSPLHLVVKAAARALKEHPRLNAVQSEDRVQLVDRVNIGIAVALEEGLITPVIQDADLKNLAELAAEGRELAAKTREGRAKPEEVTGGTFTITNLGAYDIDGFTPIINPPQVAILGVGRVVEKPIIEYGQIAKGAMMYLSLTFDHRVVDGAPAAEFLQTVKKRLEDPWWMVS